MNFLAFCRMDLFPLEPAPEPSSSAIVHDKYRVPSLTTIEIFLMFREQKLHVGRISFADPDSDFTGAIPMTNALGGGIPTNE
jgi:hypothetical protein